MDGTEEVPLCFIFCPAVATSPVPPDPADELKIKQHHGPRWTPTYFSIVRSIPGYEWKVGWVTHLLPVYLVKSDVSHSRWYSLKFEAIGDDRSMKYASPGQPEIALLISDKINTILVFPHAPFYVGQFAAFYKPAPIIQGTRVHHIWLVIINKLLWNGVQPRDFFTAMDSQGYLFHPYKSDFTQPLFVPQMV